MRHIPSAETKEISVLSFADALIPTNDDFDRSRWLYVPDSYNEYRYILGTAGTRPLICIGINPSTAAPGCLDNTLKSVDRIALGNGFDSFVMFNVYAQRATSPEDMDRSLNSVLHEENLKAFDWLLSRVSDPVIWAAWGAVIEKRPYLPGCALDLVSVSRRHAARWVTAGPRSKAGHPHHPLYLKKDAVLDPFTDLEAYLRTLAEKDESRVPEGETC